MSRKPILKPIRWVPPTYEDLVALPRDVQHTIGVALMVAQAEGRHPSAKPLKGFKGAGVLEVVEDHDGKTVSKAMKVTPANGNIFADLGLPDAEELKAKAELVIQIIQIIEDRGLKQAEAAEVMGIDQPKVSQLVRGKLDGFSMERLYRFLNALGMDVEIVVRPTPKSRKDAQLSVTRMGARPRARRSAKV